MNYYDSKYGTDGLVVQQAGGARGEDCVASIEETLKDEV